MPKQETRRLGHLLVAMVLLLETSKDKRSRLLSWARTYMYVKCLKLLGLIAAALAALPAPCTAPKTTVAFKWQLMKPTSWQSSRVINNSYYLTKVGKKSVKQVTSDTNDEQTDSKLVNYKNKTEESVCVVSQISKLCAWVAIATICTRIR